MGQNYGNGPGKKNYTNEEWLAEICRLNRDPATGYVFRAGDRVRVTGTYLRVTDLMGRQLVATSNFATERDPKRLVTDLGKRIKKIHLKEYDLKAAPRIRNLNAPPEPYVVAVAMASVASFFTPIVPVPSVASTTIPLLARVRPARKLTADVGGIPVLPG